MLSTGVGTDAWDIADPNGPSNGAMPEAAGVPVFICRERFRSVGRLDKPRFPFEIRENKCFTGRANELDKLAKTFFPLIQVAGDHPEGLQARPDRRMIIQLVNGLGGNGKTSLQTPLATVHAFNGWADKFVGANSTNPAFGLVDTMIFAVTKVSGVKLAAFYHQFETDSGSNDYGTEWDFLAAKKFGKSWTAGAKYAVFDRDHENPIAGMVNTEKFWLWGEFKF